MKSIVSFVVGLSFLSLAACAVSPDQEGSSDQSESASSSETEQRVVTHMARPPQGEQRLVVRETLPETNGDEHILERAVRPEPNAMRAENEAPLTPPAAKLDDRPFSRTWQVR